MKTAFTEAPLANQKVDAAIILTLGGKPVLPSPEGPLPGRLRKMVDGWIRAHGYEGKPGEVVLFPTWDLLSPSYLVLAGLGARKEFTPATLERTLAAAVRAAARHKLKSFAVSGGFRSRQLPCDHETFSRKVVQGADLGFYEFKRSTSRTRKRGRVSLLQFTDLGDHAKAIRSGAREGLVVASSFREVKDLANLSGLEATPEKIASVARGVARRYGLQCSVWSDTELKRESCHAILAVARGSRRGGRLITLRYAGRRRNAKPIVLVGKTITFDTGGISLKPSKSMEWMRYDKCGGMAVLAAMAVIARLKPRTPVVGLLAAAENMPGGNAIRPGDVIRTHNGKTVEVLNTDAEGRLVLADALSVAARFKPSAIVDLATLTGACVAALGQELSGLMGNQESLLKALERAGEAAGDPVWRLPLIPAFTEALSSPFADLKNIGGSGAGASVAGAFLQEFVPPGVPWAHLDVAGTAWKETPQPFMAPGATLAGAGLLIEWILRTVSE